MNYSVNSSQIIMKSTSLNKLMKLIVIKTNLKHTIKPSILLFLTAFSCVGLTAKYKIDKNTYFKLEADVKQIMSSPVADAAPLEIKFIQEKLQLAKKAKADRKKKLEAQYTEQIYADIEIAKLRAELNQLNDVLLNKRDQVSSAQVYLSELLERMQ